LQPGDKVYIAGFEEIIPEPLLPPKKKIFETVQPGFTTLPDLTVAWSKPETEGAPKQGLFVRVNGDEVPCNVPSLVGATVR
jgi:aminoacyl tRNA synthase complex-interacting multifunctional protein 1